MQIADYHDYRSEKDEFFRTSHHSPLGHGDRSGFEGLSYFEPDPEMVFTVDVAPGDGSEIAVETSDDSQKVYSHAGVVSFEIEGHPVELTLYDTGHPGCPLL